MMKRLRDLWHRLTCRRCGLCRAECSDGVTVYIDYDQGGFPDELYVCRRCEADLAKVGL